MYNIFIVLASLMSDGFVKKYSTLIVCLQKHKSKTRKKFDITITYEIQQQFDTNWNCAVIVQVSFIYFFCLFTINLKIYVCLQEHILKKHAKFLNLILTNSNLNGAVHFSLESINVSRILLLLLVYRETQYQNRHCLSAW